MTAVRSSRWWRGAILAAFALACCATLGCEDEPAVEAPRGKRRAESQTAPAAPPVRLDKYAAVSLEANLAAHSEGDRAALEALREAATALDDVFWLQTVGPGKEELLTKITDPALRRSLAINYGPWDRLEGDRPILPILPRPASANFYPMRIQPQEMETAMAASIEAASRLSSPYTIVQYDTKGGLVTVPYHEAFEEPLSRAAVALERAAASTGHAGLARYLKLRAAALRDDSYQASTEAWFDTLDAPLIVVAGPLSRDEDALFHYKQAFGMVVAVPRPELSSRFERWQASFAEMTGAPAAGRMLAGDLVICTGECNAGPKQIHFVLPPEGSPERRGTVGLTVANVIEAKYEANLVPIVTRLFVSAQRERSSHEAYLAQSVWSEIAKQAADEGRSTDRDPVVQAFNNDVLSLRFAEYVAASGREPVDLESHYVTFVGTLIRSVSLGTASARGPASLALYNHLEQERAITRGDGGLGVDVERMKVVVRELATRLAELEAQGARDELEKLVNGLRVPNQPLATDLSRLVAEHVPLDVHFDGER